MVGAVWFLCLSSDFWLAIIYFMYSRGLYILKATLGLMLSGTVSMASHCRKVAMPIILPRQVPWLLGVITKLHIEITSLINHKGEVVLTTANLIQWQKQQVHKMRHSNHDGVCFENVSLNLVFRTLSLVFMEIQIVVTISTKWFYCWLTHLRNNRNVE